MAAGLKRWPLDRFVSASASAAAGDERRRPWSARPKPPCCAPPALPTSALRCPHLPFPALPFPVQPYTPVLHHQQVLNGQPGQLWERLVRVADTEWGEPRGRQAGSGGNGVRSGQRSSEPASGPRHRLTSHHTSPKSPRTRLWREPPHAWSPAPAPSPPPPPPAPPSRTSRSAWSMMGGTGAPPLRTPGDTAIARISLNQSFISCR